MKSNLALNLGLRHLARLIASVVLGCGALQAQQGRDLAAEIEQAVQRRDYDEAVRLQQAQQASQAASDPNARRPLEVNEATRRGGVQVDAAGNLVVGNRMGATAEWAALRGVTGYYRLVARLERVERENDRGSLFVEISPLSSNRSFQRVVVALRRVQGNRLEAGPLYFDSSGRGLTVGVEQTRRDARSRGIPGERSGEASPNLVRLSDLALEKVPDPGADQGQRLMELRATYDRAYRERVSQLALDYHRHLSDLARERLAESDVGGADRASARADEIASEFRLAIAGREHEPILLAASEARVSGREVRAQGTRIDGFHEDGDSVSFNLQGLELPTRRVRVRIGYQAPREERGRLRVSLSPHQEDFELMLPDDQGGAVVETEAWDISGGSQTLRIGYDPKREEAWGFAIERVELVPVE